MSSSFIPDYLCWASDNEAPEMFHVWGGFMALSTVISRRVWIPWGRRAIYPNLYCLLVGDAGNGKSIAMDFFVMLMNEAANQGVFDGRLAPLSYSVETPQGLLRFIAGNPKAKPPIESSVKFLSKFPNGAVCEVHPMTIRANEFTNFIGMDQEGWMGMLNDISDRDSYTYRTKGQGEDVLQAPYICLFGGLPTETSHDLQRAKVIASGFARRTIFQFGVRKWHDPHPKLTETPEQLAAFERVLAHLKRLPSTFGAIAWSDDADAFWDKWYREHNVQVPKRPPHVRSWFGTKPDHVLRLAILVMLSEYDFTLTLYARHMQVAIEFLEKMEADLWRVFGGTGRNDLMPVVAAIHAYVAGLTEPVGQKQLLLHFIKDLPRRQDLHKEFQQCLDILKDEGKIATASVGLANPDKPNEVVAYETLIGLPEVIREFLAKRGGTPPKPQP